MSDAASTDRIAAVRRFNRFITRQVGALREGLLHSRYSLAEARLIYEIAQHESIGMTLLAQDLGLDLGYLSRTVSRLEAEGLLEKTRTAGDGRQRLIRLTGKGRRLFAMLDRRSSDEVAGVLARLSDSDQSRMLSAMRTIEDVLGGPTSKEVPFILRAHEPGDMGWVIERHGAIYADEYGWDTSFEALVAQICADFITHLDTARERCWIAEMNGQRVGCVFVVKVDDMTSKLRLLLVEPEARGLGLGGRLVDECIAFSRETGATTLTLWTNSILTAARHLYESRGFRLTNAEAHHSFGHDLIGEHWDLRLS